MSFKKTNRPEKQEAAASVETQDSAVETAASASVSTAESNPYGDEAGVGFEGVSTDELLMPFIAVLQSNSKPISEETVAGARPGMLMNTVTNELFDGERGIVFQPVTMEHVYVEWMPRTRGGGFRGRHDLTSDVVKAAMKEHLEKHGDRFAKDADDKLIPITVETDEGQNELIETYYVYGQVLDDEGKDAIGFAVIAFTSKKIKPYRAWTTTMFTMRGRPPIFAHRARISTVREKNEKGTYFNVRINPLVEGNWRAGLIPPTTEEGQALLAGGRQLKEMIEKGFAKANFESQESAAGEEVPF